MNIRLVIASPLAAFSDAALLALRLITGSFLIYGVWDNLTDTQRMKEFVAFLTQFGFYNPAVLAPISCWAQFLCGVAFVIGGLTRIAGLMCAFNFIVAIWMVHWPEDYRTWWPALVLIVIGFFLGTHGGGRFGLDAIFERQHKASAPAQ